VPLYTQINVPWHHLDCLIIIASLGLLFTTGTNTQTTQDTSASLALSCNQLLPPHGQQDIHLGISWTAFQLKTNTLTSLGQVQNHQYHINNTRQPGVTWAVFQLKTLLPPHGQQDIHLGVSWTAFQLKTNTLLPPLGQLFLTSSVTGTAFQYV